MKQESYEESIKKHDAYTKIGSQEAEIEELKEEIDRLKSSESKRLYSDNKVSTDTSSDSSGSGNLRSPNEDSFISSIYNNIMDKIKHIEDLDLLQIYAGCNLIISIS